MIEIYYDKITVVTFINTEITIDSHLHELRKQVLQNLILHDTDHEIIIHLIHLLL